MSIALCQNSWAHKTGGSTWMSMNFLRHLIVVYVFEALLQGNYYTLKDKELDRIVFKVRNDWPSPFFNVPVTAYSPSLAHTHRKKKIKSTLSKSLVPNQILVINLLSPVIPDLQMLKLSPIPSICSLDFFLIHSIYKSYAWLTCRWCERFKHFLTAVCSMCTCFNKAPGHLQMLASVASVLVWRFNFRGAASWWTRGLLR